MSANRLLLVTPDFSPNVGGVARYLERLAEYFSNRIQVITSAPQTASFPFSVIHENLLFRSVWPRWLKTVFLLIRRRHDYDIVLISHLIPFGTAALVATWITHKPYVVIVHGMDVRLTRATGVKRGLAWLILKQARVVVANSRALANEIAETFHTSLPIVAYPCLSENNLEQIDTPHSKEHPFTLLTVSRLIERKGHTQVLTALSKLKQSGMLTEFVYHVVGSGPMEATLKEMVTELRLSEIQFHGTLSDEELNRYYQEVDVFVMPVQNDVVDKEGFGFVFLEAAAHGVPSISTQIPGVDEAILDGHTGMLIDPQQNDALMNAILRLSRDPQERTRLGTQARQRAQQEFVCAQQFAKLEPFL